MASSSSSSRDQDLAYLIVQFLEEHKLTETARMLEKECGIFLNMKYVEEAVTNGQWKSLEDYLLSFTKINDNQYSFKMFFEIKKQKYIEALDNGEHANALEILIKDLKMFADCNQDLFVEIAQLLTLNNIRENEKLSRHYKDTKSARCAVFSYLKKLIESNPVLKDRLKFPNLKSSSLKRLMNQSISWQHMMCKHPKPNPSISTVFVDHTCEADMVPSPNDVGGQTLQHMMIPEINEPAQLCSLRLPDPMLSVKIDRLTYTSSGGAILALPYSGIHKLWKWEMDANNAITSEPQLWQPSSGILMTNAVSSNEDAVPCLALSNNDAYVASASGGTMSLHSVQTFQTLATFMPPPPAATSVIFYPEDNNIIIIGMEDGSIRIYDVRTDEVKARIHGHQKRVTGLAYSTALNVLVSSGPDAQLCAWSRIGWVKLACKLLLDVKGLPMSPGHSRVKFHPDQRNLMVVHENHIATLEGPNLDPCKQWISRELITDAAYSCDGHSIYASFEDGRIKILGAASLALRCLINPSAYLPATRSMVYPCAIATHPTQTNQFALGLSDGAVQIIEPRQGVWPG